MADAARLAELIEPEHGRAGDDLVIARARPDDREPQHAIVADQPMDGARLKAIAHEQGTDLPIQPMDLHPGGRGE